MIKSDAVFGIVKRQELNEEGVIGSVSGMHLINDASLHLWPGR